MGRPLIGLIGGLYSSRDETAVYGLSAAYTKALAMVGASPVVIAPNVDEDALRDLFQRCDGVLIAGGGDIDPARYGLPDDGLVHGVDPYRDSAEIHFVKWSVEADKPLLGICRGCQVANVALGGTLYRDIDKEYSHNGQHVKHDLWGIQPRNYLAHSVHVEPDTRLAGILGSGSIPVNSLHHQALHKVASSLSVTATSSQDGLIEAVEMPDARFFVAVQWHPEELVNDSEPMRHLFAAFVAATHP